MSTSQTQSDNTSTATKPKKRRLLKIIVIVFVLLTISLLMLPMLLSGPFKGVIVSQINNQLNGSATIDSLSLSWFGSQKVAGFKIADQAGQMLLEIEKIDLPSVSLFGLATGNRDFGDVSLHIKALHVVQLTDGSNNLQRVVKSSSSSTTSTESSESTDTPAKTVSVEADQAVSQMIPKGMAANVNLVMDQMTFSAPDQEVTNLTDTRVDLSVKAGQPIVGKLASNLNQGPLRGSVTSNLDIDKTVDMTNTQVTLDVTPEAWAAAAKTSSAKLLEPFGIVLAINRLKLPAFGGASGLSQLEADLNMTITDVQLQSTDQNLGTLKLSGTSLQLNAMGDNQPVTLRFKGQVTQSNQQGTFDLNVDLQNLLADLAANDTKLSNVKATITGSVQNVGLVIFDELFQTGGLISNAVGPTLTASINSQMQYDKTSGLPNGNLDFKAKSQFINADLALKIDQSGINHVDTGRMTMQITPALYAVATKLPADKPVLLTQPFLATLQITKLNIPRTQNQWQIHDAVIDLALNFEDVLLRSGEDQVIKLAKPAWTLKSEKFGQKIEFVGGFQASQAGGSPGAFAMSSKVINLFDGKGDLQRDKAQFEANMTLLPWQLPTLLPVFKKLKFNVNKLVNQVVGAKQTITLKGRMLPTEAGLRHPQVPNMWLKLSTSSIAINTDVTAMIKNDLVVLDPQSSVDVKVTPELLALFTGSNKTNGNGSSNGNGNDIPNPNPNPNPKANANPQPVASASPAPMTLAKPVTFKGKVTELVWPIDQAQMDKAVIAMQLSADRLEPSGLPGGLNASLRNAVLTLGKGNTTTLPIRLTAEMYEGNTASGKLDTNVSLTDLLGTVSARDLKLIMSDVPVALVDTLSGMQGKVFAVLGSRIDTLAVTADGPLDKDMQMNVAAKSNVLEISAKAKMQDQFLIVEPGSKINLIVTPDAVDKLQKTFKKNTTNTPKTTSSDWQLVKPASLQFAIEKLTVPTGGGSLAAAQIGIGFGAQRLAFVQTSTKLPMVIDDLKMRVDAANLGSPLNTSLSANMIGQDAQGKTYQSPLSSQTVITNLLDKDGKVDALHATIQTDTQIPQLPIELIDALTGQDGKLAGIIGPTADIKAVGSYPGNIDLSLVGKFTSLSIPANIDTNRNLTLRKDAIVTLAVTPETAKTLLKYGNPVLIDATSSRDPIKATIFAKDFSMPLEGFELSKLSADMQLELGTISLQNSWLLNSMGEGLGNLDRSLNISSKQDAKFTNLMINMRNGVTQTNDLWMQIDDVKLMGKSRINTLTIGTQGSVDLVKSTVNMGMAIPAVTLYSIGSSLRKYVSADTIFELPIVGPLNGVKPQGIKELAIQLGAMVAGGELAGDKLGGLGAILGQVAGSAISGGDVKQFKTKRTWPNKPAVKEPVPVAEETTTQQQTQQQAQQTQQQQIAEPKKEEKKNDTQKTIDALRGLFGN